MRGTRAPRQSRSTPNSPAKTQDKARSFIKEEHLRTLPYQLLQLQRWLISCYVVCFITLLSPFYIFSGQGTTDQEQECHWPPDEECGALLVSRAVQQLSDEHEEAQVLPHQVTALRPQLRSDHIDLNYFRSREKLWLVGSLNSFHAQIKNISKQENSRYWAFNTAVLLEVDV